MPWTPEIRPDDKRLGNATDSAQLYLRQAVDGVKDDTHFSEYGAGQIAGLVVQGIRERNLPLVPYLR